MTAFAMSISRSSTSRGISRYAGPGAPLKHSRAAIDTMSATRSVERTLAENLVIGRIMSTCGRSCSEPIMCCVSAPWPPMCSTGLSQRNAVATPVTAFVQPGPGRGDDDAELAGLARVAVGRVRGDLLVPHVDDADALVDAAVVDVDDVAAAQREDRVDAFVLQRPRGQVAAGDDVGVAALLLERIVGCGRRRLVSDD